MHCINNVQGLPAFKTYNRKAESSHTIFDVVPLGDATEELIFTRRYHQIKGNQSQELDRFYHNTQDTSYAKSMIKIN